MLEALLVTDEENRKTTVFTGAVLFTALSLLAARFLLPFHVSGQNLGGLITVVIASIALAYPLSQYMRGSRAEEETHRKLNEKTLLHRHVNEVEVYLSFFTGSLLVFTAATFLFSPGFFEVQHGVIGNITAATGNAINSGGVFTSIVLNNLQLFFITFLLTFFISGGMVFILVWNASVFGVFLGTVTNSLPRIPFLAVSYLPHGFLEVAAYIAAGIAGIILSREVEVYFVERTGERQVFLRVWKDVLILLGLGAATIVLAGVIETV